MFVQEKLRESAVILSVWKKSAGDKRELAEIKESEGLLKLVSFFFFSDRFGVCFMVCIFERARNAELSSQLQKAGNLNALERFDLFLSVGECRFLY